MANLAQSTTFFMLWGYANPLNFLQMNCFIMKLSQGGITLDYIENYMTPYDRDQYWYTFMEIEKERVEQIESSNKNSGQSETIDTVYGKPW